ncbi:MAG: shikimate dehydrogenase [Lachnospiraceae bacterium]|nr:shikimate dehydrogenase [Lachnospiraceae bacterium]
MGKEYREELVGVFGDPVDENPTVVVAQKAFETMGIPYRYLTINVHPEDLKAALEGLKAMNFKGMHLTIPHKVAAIPYLDSISEEASIMGAVNTIVNLNGKLYGENTDGKGFMTSVINAGIEVCEKKVTMLGAGGAARAIAVELARAGIGELVIINRSEERGRGLVETLKNHFPDLTVSYRRWNHTMVIDENTNILVNTTDIGLYPHVDARPDIDFNSIHSRMVVCDVIPNHPHTQLLKEAERRQAKTIDGLGMLINQCVESIRYWTGKTAEAEVMKEALAEEYGIDVYY